MNKFFIFLNIIIFSLKIIAGELPTGENTWIVDPIEPFNPAFTFIKPQIVID